MLNQRNDLVQYGEIHYYKNVISDPKKIIEIVEDTDLKIQDGGTVTKWQDWQSSNKDYLFGKQKQEMSGDVTKTPKELVDCINLIKSSIIDVSNNYASCHNVNLGKLSSIAISKYLAGSSMGSHVDSGEDGPRNPVLSVLVYFNDDYDGGELDFSEQKIKIKPRPGSIVIFPSKKPYFHASLPVLNGTKYLSLGFWYLDSIS